MAKNKADPFLSCPDGSRAKSAWLTKLQAEAQALIEKADNTTYAKLLATHTLEANSALVRSRSIYLGGGHPQTAVDCECLIQWHGPGTLDRLADHLANKHVVRLVDSFHTDAAQALLLSRLNLPEVREAVADRAARWPLYTLRGLLALNPSRDQPAAQLLQRLLYAHPAWLAPLQAALAAASDEAQSRTLARLLTPTEKVTEASIDELPALLRAPPWRADAARVELPVLELTPRRAPAVVDWSRWRGGTVELRPQIRSNMGYTIHSIRFDDAPGLLHAFLASESLLGEADLLEWSDQVRQGRYGRSFFVASMAEKADAFATVTRFLHSTGRLSDDDLRALGKWNDLHCHVVVNVLSIGRTYFRVEEEFMNYLDRGLKTDPTRNDELAALRRYFETDWDRRALALFLWGVKPDHIATVLANNAVGQDDLRELPWASGGLLNHLGYLDDALALSLLRQPAAAHATANQHYEFGRIPDTCGNPAARLLKRFGAEHIDAILPVLPPVAGQAAQMIMEIVDSDELALRLSQYAYTVRSQLRTFARDWLLAHPQTSTRALIPAAFSADAGSAAHARQHLYLLSREGHGEILRAEARAYGEQALAAVETLLATPAEALLPAQLPKLPAWLVLPRLPRLLLAASGHAVPLANLPDALMPLALSKGGMSYAGLDQLQAAVTPDSLARLMLGLFEQWLENGMPPKDRWIFELQGRLGDDANARALAPRIREWRSHLDRVRSYEGLEMLARIGSDTALMLLSTYREQKRYSDLQDRAAKALARVAEERDLTLEQLADRTVPTLGLDERGRLLLDFGPRQFIASLNADLLPQVHDAAGMRQKDLPKPGAKDDAALAKDAVANWKEFKKQAKLVASTQSVRMEAAMCGQRRWPTADFLAFFARHPVLRTLCQRLVWAAFDAQGILSATFRVSEDLSLADVDDAPCELDAAGRVGLPHALELAEDLRNRWLTLLADYEVLQPFEQLARATYAMTAEEMPLNALPRYEHRRLSTGSLLGLEQRGWSRSVGDDGMIDCLSKSLGDQHVAVLSFDPGWFVGGAPSIDEEQEIGALRLASLASVPEGSGGAPPQPAWGDLPAIARSEMLRDLERLAWHTRD
ncbi:DUF4132 domain-containing protein [Candidatus Accumulibacter vicinus]|uniref:DUF4132 domain-containing protein n=1 Tax=Candidatus Accumulibacter vicinus TaxID=2954382 RepID=A0A084Y5N7_9PROT|nr:DUF4132 domain-containing protein [Candidatus Accumulibacter vicinus]KFB70031.1 MAG: hypothetical protein CAPSK01_000430 [Candidatus Accumulibacter vicinus]